MTGHQIHTALLRKREEIQKCKAAFGALVQLSPEFWGQTHGWYSPILVNLDTIKKGLHADCCALVKRLADLKEE